MLCRIAIARTPDRNKEEVGDIIIADREIIAEEIATTVNPATTSTVEVATQLGVSQRSSHPLAHDNLGPRAVFPQGDKQLPNDILQVTRD